MTALTVSAAAILADIARRGGDQPPPPRVRTENRPEFNRLISIGVNPATARYLARRLDHVAFTPATPIPLVTPRPTGCGTHAAFNTHRRHAETPCAPCVTAERRYQKRRTRHSPTARAHSAAVRSAA
jgi:hypothetical protein